MARKKQGKPANSQPAKISVQFDNEEHRIELERLSTESGITKSEYVRFFIIDAIEQGIVLKRTFEPIPTKKNGKESH